MDSTTHGSDGPPVEHNHSAINAPAPICVRGLLINSHVVYAIGDESSYDPLILLEKHQLKFTIVSWGLMRASLLHFIVFSILQCLHTQAGILFWKKRSRFQ